MFGRFCQQNFVRTINYSIHAEENLRPFQILMMELLQNSSTTDVCQGHKYATVVSFSSKNY